ncbi:5'-methylthioadenosine/S-adenosylhomocysteine nucleosidase [Pantoea sp. Aalb]|uniref:5'-methylthioadenosine/S-adenosylhomocysteine nucleosidase n=1 Tax=Pantoea sp. Aalb TaxID=2576762 RepID=UPI0013223A16|nr:5'-methylthioadenosine/S-adenosylhomocysteine nucleosidase [Pantoea sp. Aalb]MXP67211.1 5'-methylthioadenosine/S-adenosylhomocysteine nucleosidase [Pantoea sp. Aalb]
MFTIGIIGAMEQEIMLLRDRIQNSQTLILYQYTIHIGVLNDVNIVLLKSGVGKTAAAISTTLLISVFNPKIIINIGSAGLLVPTLHIGDIIICDEMCYHDVDVTSFGYQLGQIPDYPKSFFSDKKLVFLAEQVIKKLNLHAATGLIVTGDAFINDNKILKRIRNNFPQAIAVEMEATSIAQVCYQFNIPLLVIRAISDLANQQSKLDFTKFLNLSVQQFSLVVEKILKTCYLIKSH